MNMGKKVLILAFLNLLLVASFPVVVNISTVCVHTHDEEGR